jgi:hypothetical protein
MRGELKFQISLAPGSFRLNGLNFTFRNLYRNANAFVQQTTTQLTITTQGSVESKVSLTFLMKVRNGTIEPHDISASTLKDDRGMTAAVLFVPDSRPVTMTVH